MGEKEPGERRDEPSLELPTLRLPGRRRKKQPTPAEPAQPVGPSRPDEPFDKAQEPPFDKAQEPPSGEGQEPPAETRSRRLRLPAVPAVAAAAVTGLLVGLLATVLTAGEQAGCEAVTGVGTCGGGVGLLLLLVNLVLMILVGAALLRAGRVPEPTSTSFLGVGVVAVVALLVLVDVLFSPWMFLAVPLVGAAAYALAHWVTTRFVEDDSPGLGPDVR